MISSFAFAQSRYRIMIGNVGLTWTWKRPKKSFGSVINCWILVVISLMLCCAARMICGEPAGSKVAGSMWLKDLCMWFCCSQNRVTSLAAAYSCAASCSRGAMFSIVTIINMRGRSSWDSELCRVECYGSLRRSRAKLLWAPRAMLLYVWIILSQDWVGRNSWPKDRVVEKHSVGEVQCQCGCRCQARHRSQVEARSVKANGRQDGTLGSWWAPASCHHPSIRVPARLAWLDGTRTSTTRNRYIMYYVLYTMYHITCIIYYTVRSWTII